MRRMRLGSLALFVMALPQVGNSQIVLVDTIERLPPVGICQDGATHRTICTNQRLQGRGVNLDSFVSRAVELRGMDGSVVCQKTIVTAATQMSATHRTTTAVGGASMAAFFHAATRAGSTVHLFVSGGLTPVPFAIPPIAGVLHLDPLTLVFMGSFTPLGFNTPYLSQRFPLDPALLGVTFYDQALVTHINLPPEWTNVDCFEF